jgi:hypothetical protein
MKYTKGKWLIMKRKIADYEKIYKVYKNIKIYKQCIYEFIN